MRVQTGRFRRADRLRRSREFQYVADHGQRVAGRTFVLLVSASPMDLGDSLPRLGITVSRRVGNAVVRNRLKRRVREWFRKHRDELRSGIDLVVIGRGAAARLPGAEVDVALAEATRQVGACR